MRDFEQATVVEKIEEGHYRANLDPDWKIWGPCGGYIAAMALRAVGDTSRFKRPASIACQFLSFARIEPVDLWVKILREGKRTEALRVDIIQKDTMIFSAQVWMAGEGEGLIHDFTQMPDVPPPEELQNLSELTNGKEGDSGVYKNFEQRPLNWIPYKDRTPGEPVIQTWFRFRPRARSENLIVDATRSLVMIDIFSWLSTYGAYPSEGPSPWIAPNLDLYVRFHADTTSDDWVFNEMRADIAEGGLIGAEGTVWTRNGKLAASGSLQLFCRPRSTLSR